MNRKEGPGQPPCQVLGSPEPPGAGAPKVGASVNAGDISIK